jgi:predicted DNA-binding helix-hairpin-helix protein
MSSETGREICHDDLSRLAALGRGTKYDVCASSHSSAIPGVYHSFTFDGRCISLFKSLYTNSCYYQCNYCINASGCRSKIEAFTYALEELARLTLSLYKSNYVEGLFLSSAAGRAEDAIMAKMIEAVQLLSGKYQFKGYLLTSGSFHEGGDESFQRLLPGHTSGAEVHQVPVQKDRPFSRPDYPAGGGRVR